VSVFKFSLGVNSRGEISPGGYLMEPLSAYERRIKYFAKSLKITQGHWK